MKRTLSLLLGLLLVLSVNAKIKYVFYFIGDGMGTNQVLAAEMYRAELQGGVGRVPTCMSQFPVSGQISTYSASNGITDSSAAGTCLATGHKTNNGVLGLGPKGDTLTTIAETLKQQGWSIGIMTSVAIDHATPGAFYGHDQKRGHYYEIGQQLTRSGFDFFGGAGFHYPQGKHGDKEVNLYDLTEKAGYTITRSYDEAQRHLNDQKLILIQPGDTGTANSDCIGYAIDQHTENSTLKQIVSTAIPFLERKQKPFFMMVEGGMIDYACHGDDGRTAIDEVWAMDEALEVAYRFYLRHPDETLIVVTADHETGGMALGNSDYTLNLQILQHQKCSSWVLSDRFTGLFQHGTPTWEQVQQVWRDNLGFWGPVSISEDEEKELREAYQKAVQHEGEDMKTMYKDINQLGSVGIEILNRKSKLGWTSNAHTGHAVPVFAAGVGAELFTGWHDNSQVAPLILQAIQQSAAKPRKCRH
ncbi:MAG: alkaline phosphatase [Paludibacteraceae bacterium]|nr:alkaline phosphatase [Paludibacteraceae bacterium]MBQ2607818.1 alkaline phosphatase [Paludibacteraceae bacterium]